MNPHLVKPIVACLFGLLSLNSLSQEVTVNTEIATIALDESVTDMYFHNGKDISLFQANPTGLGEPLKYKGPRRFMLRTSEAEFAMKPPLPKPHAWVDLPLDSDRVLLVCLKTADAPVKLIAYDIGKARIGAGEYRFFNFSHSIISVMLGERKFVVKPGQDTMVSDTSWKNDIMEIDVMMGLFKDDKTKPVYSSQWGNRPGRRNYVFLFDGPQEYKPIKICRFFDVPPAETEAPKP